MVRSRRLQVVLKLGKGQFFGEVVLAVPDGVGFKFKVSVLASSNLSVCILDREAFFNLGIDSPQLLSRMYLLMKPAMRVKEWLHILSKDEGKVAREMSVQDFTHEDVEEHLLRRMSFTRMPSSTTLVSGM